jgi:phenylpropionate dioxygenase-like ring-hydroxylating dioxygenase large terminal subunit
MAVDLRTTLPGRDYFGPEVFELDRERIFFRHWYYAGRADGLEAPGDYLAVDIAGESIVVVRGKDERLRGFYNVCRHRGSRLCDAGSGHMRGAIKCPYHAWSYAFDGRLIGTPMVSADEIDRESLGLWPVAVDTWAGFLFVNFAPDPEPLHDSLAAQYESPLAYERFGPLGELRAGFRTVTDVAANWKILVENYNECLHCPAVHPELVAVVPTYRRGEVIESGRTDGGVGIAGDGTSFTRSGKSALPVMPGFDENEATSIYAAFVFPNMFLDISGTSTVATCLHPRGPEQTTIVAEYLFRPETIAEPGFDPSEIVEFTELVAHQDYVVCERVQQGVRSRAFTRGVYAEKDELPLAFNRRYLAARDAQD